MNIWNKLKAKLQRKPRDPKDIWKDDRYVIKHVFTAGGIDYYAFDDQSNMPYERSFQSLVYFNELSENCTKEVMKEFHTEFGKCFQGQKVDLTRLIKIHSVLGDRLYKLPPAPALIERLASVIYFDKNENPTTYDMKYNLEKIARWKKDFPEGSFFLFEPIKTLAPFLKESQMNLSTYLKTWEKLESMTLSDLLSIGSEKMNNTEQNKAVN